jgi:uncharacterized membrane protein HdeD (DUF308 family)
MSAASAPAGHAPMSEARVVTRDIAGLWWIWLITGIAWCIASLVVLQFDRASITTIGIVVGCLFSFAAFQQFLLFALGARLRWLWASFGVLFLVAAIVCFVNPEATFAGLADTLGFLFLIVGVWWTVDAFAQRDDNPIWWLGLVAGVLMLILAFWTSGQFFIEKAYALLAFSGIWALMQGFTDIVRAFRLRGLRDDL